MEVIRLTPGDCELLATRYVEYDNSQRKMEEALEQADEPGELARLRALRRLERHFGIDLGSLCFRFERRDDPELHPLERRILDSIAFWRTVDGADAPADAPTDELWILVDHVRHLRELAGEEHTGWLQSTQG